MNEFFDQYFSASFMHSLMNFLIALVVLVVGWLIAKAIGKTVEKALHKTNWDEKVFKRYQVEGEATSDDRKKIDTNEIIGKIVYYFLLLIVIILFLNMLSLTILAGPLSNLVATLLSIIPAILKAVLIFAVAWAIGFIVQWLIAEGTKKFNLTRLFYKMKVAKTEEEIQGYMRTIGKVAFYLILLLFLPAILNALNITGVAEPFTNLLHSILAFIPKLAAAVLTFAVGWFVAKITKTIVTNLLQSVGSEKLVSRFNLTKLFEGTTLAGFVGNLVFILILIPVTIAALEQLEIAGITDPAISMLDKAVSMIPNIAVAIVLILVGVWLGKFIGKFVRDFLGNIGFNRITEQMDVNERKMSGKLAPAALVGYIVQVLIVFFMTIQAFHVLQLDFLVGIATAVTAYLPMVLAAVLTLGVALILANIVEKVLKNILSGPAARTLALFAKITIITIAVFMALTQLGIAPSIVNAAFILILGGLSLAFGLAFGLGGKDFAAKYLKKFDNTIEETTIKEEGKRNNE
ncbi:mechanosensitive ion channel [Oceanobacillus alkalisoli]|uniref:mechanosensitive ion channel n=1 Tax=Oceanobacillus alkalisoli TaxID=2925113 RepID=UPI001F11C44A|nr:mechanosensitive ion channel [Oceanobacillus alkalisoli]MCF3943487.1 mechanosensitive ion channel [Oceanobacillus alkalisoli]